MQTSKSAETDNYVSAYAELLNSMELIQSSGLLIKNLRTKCQRLKKDIILFLIFLSLGQRPTNKSYESRLDRAKRIKKMGQLGS